MSTPPQNSINFRFEPWVLFEETNGKVTIKQSFKDGKAKFAKGDRSEIASEIATEDTIRLAHDINAKAKELLGDDAPKLLGFHAVVVDSPENPAVHNRAVHVVLLFEAADGTLLSIPYGNSLVNELLQALKKRSDLSVNPDEVNNLATASFNWMLDPKGGNVKTIGIAFDYDKHVDSYGKPEEGSFDDQIEQLANKIIAANTSDEQEGALVNAISSVLSSDWNKKLSQDTLPDLKNFLATAIKEKYPDATYKTTTFLRDLAQYMEEKYPTTIRSLEIPPTYQLFAGVDATGKSKEYTDRTYNVLHAYWLGEKEKFAKPAAQDADSAVYLIEPEDGLAYLSTEENQAPIGKPEAQGSGSIVYLLEPKNAPSYFFAEENTDLRAWVYETRHLIQAFERTHPEVRATEAQRLENMGNADETLKAFTAAQKATTR